MSWVLRTATLDDLDAIMAIEHATFPHDAWSSASMRAELSDPHGHYLVAAAADDPADPAGIVGYAGLRAPRGLEQGDIQTVAVAESARRHGLGRTLVRALLAEARERGAEEIFLEVRADNPAAQNLYLELGFEEIAVRPNYYPPGVDAIVMKLVLPEPTVVPA